MNCFSCGTNNPEHLDVCSQCGLPLENRCAACGAANSPQGQFCGSCGIRLAERRQLTVLFCDLVGSTALSERLGTEEWDLVLHAYHERCREIVDRSEGHVAQYLGDGVLIYFGHPFAHEDDAQRAVRTALAIQAGVKNLRHGFQKEGGPELSVRLGIDTGEVIVGRGRDQLAVGETLNIAARVQTLADPDTIVMTAATHRLVEPYFICQDLGSHRLKGLERQVQLYRVEGETGVQTRMQAAATFGIVPLVGRDKEANFLRECWQRSCSGNGQVVLVRGEPGIGKSRLIEVLKGHLAGETYSLLECYCLAYDQHTAFAPLSHLLRRTLGFKREDTPQEKLSKLRSAMEGLGLAPEDAIPLLAPLVSLTPDVGYTPLDITPLRTRQLTLETLTTWLLRITETSPVLFIIEDLHWIDPSSLELLDHLMMNQQGSNRMLILLTCRPEFQAKWPAKEVQNALDLTRLTQEQTAALATLVAHNRTLPAEVLQEVVKRTDGVPLFVEELTKTILESGFLKSVNGSYELSGPLPSGAIPATVQASLMARLDRLGSAKTLAQLGATIGRDFRHDVLLAVAKMGEVEIERDLARLIDANLVTRDRLPPLATYSFRHVLIQETAYNSLLKSTRVLYHERIAGTLFERFPEITENQPELLAEHYSSAGSPGQAMVYWQKAGQRAMERSANVEAIHHFRKCLELLAHLPETPERIQQELMLQLHLGLPLMATKGYGAADVGATFARARQLCLQIGEVPQLAPVLYGLWTYDITRCEWEATQEMATQLMVLAEQQQDKDLLLEAHTAQGITDVWAGPDLPSAQRHLEQAVSLYDLEQHYSHALVYSQDPGVVSLANLAWALWMQGYPEQSFQRLDQLRKLAKDRAHAYSTAYSFAWEATVRLWARCVREAKEVAEQGIAFTVEKGFPLWTVVLTYVRCWVMAQEGQGEEAVVQFRQALEGWRATGALVSQPYQFGVLADTWRHIGRIEPALEAMDEALALVRRYREYWYEPELHRLRGDLLLLQARPDTKEAETCFLQSLEIARRQSAKSWELRTSMSLARLWQRQQKQKEAHKLLSECYGWFTEGFETPDFQDARTLLKQLR